jgi:hypothetical protein
MAAGTAKTETRMDLHKETPLETAQRQVADCKARIAQQEALVANLCLQGRDLIDAQTLLASMKDVLRFMRAHLADEQAHAAGSSPT